MIPRAQITAILLAGGLGRRMDGADKGLLSFKGRALITHVIDIIRPQVGALVISINRHWERYAELGYPLVSDHDTGFAGPLAGIVSVLARLPTHYALVVPCDMPHLPLNLVDRLAQALIDGDAQVAVAHGAGRLQPLCILFGRDMEQDLRLYRESGGAKVESWLRRLRYVTVDFSNQPDAFFNINNPADFSAAEAADKSIFCHQAQPAPV